MRSARVVLCVLLPLLGAAGCGTSSTNNEHFTIEFVNVASFQSAAVVFGQPIFVLNDPNQGLGDPRADTLSGPGMPSHGALFLPDVNNNRVLGFHQSPVISNLSASFVLGQPGFKFAGAGLGPTAMRAPLAAVATADRLFVSDRGNNRVLIWHTLPTSGASPPEVALGQPGLVTNAESGGASGMRGPAGISAPDGRLIVADPGNHRVLIWNAVPAVSGAPADLVLGQADLGGVFPNRGLSPAAGTLRDPFSVWSDGEFVAVADRGNHRVLIWTTFPTSNGQPAEVVLGQQDFSSVGAGAGPFGMRSPSDLASNGSQLFVADAGNHRILIWNTFPPATGAPPDVVLGQAGFQGTAPNDDNQDGTPDSAPTARTLFAADDLLTVRVYGNQIYVGDSGNHRMLVFEGD